MMEIENDKDVLKGIRQEYNDVRVRHVDLHGYQLVSALSKCELITYVTSADLVLLINTERLLQTYSVEKAGEGTSGNMSEGSRQIETKSARPST